MRWRTSLSLLRHPALHWFKYADWYKIQHLAAHTERSELPQKPERSEKKYLYLENQQDFSTDYCQSVV